MRHRVPLQSFALVAAIWGAFPAGIAAQVPQTPQVREAVVQEITLRGTVEAVDHTARIVRIRGAQGNVVTLDVPTSATRFDQVKVGDMVTIAYYDRVNIRPHAPGEAAIDQPADPATTPNLASLYGGTMAAQRITTVTIDAWDPATRTVSFTTPSGQSYTRRINETIDHSVIIGLKVGDRVDVTRTEAIRLAVDPPATTVAATSQTPPPLPPTYDDFRHRFTLGVFWGPDNQFSGKVIQAGSGVYQDTVPINFNETNYDDVYGAMSLFKVGVGYRTSPRIEFVGNFVWSTSGSDPVQIGTLGTENAPLTADFDSYKYWGIEAGQRFYFARFRLTPYLGYTVGMNRFTHIDGTFSAPATGAQPAFDVVDGQFFDSSWAFSASPIGGVLIGLGPIELMGEIGFRFMSGLSDVDPLSQVGLKDINAESSRWSVPLLIGARLRF